MWKWIFSVFTVFLLGIGFLGRNPNIDLQFRRVVESDVQLASLSGFLTDIQSWPGWFYQLKSVRVVGGSEKPGVGSILEFDIEPGNKKWNRFTMRVELLEFSPQSVRMKILDDSRGLFKKLVDHLEWGVRLEPQPNGKILISGTGSATTATVKGRVFGRLSERILLNQLFYSDLESLGRGLKAPEETFTLVPN